MWMHPWACIISEIKLILMLKRGCIPLNLVKEPFWDSYKKILTFYLNIFVEKCKIEYKKKDPFFPKFWVGQKKGKQTSFLGLMIQVVSQ